MDIRQSGKSVHDICVYVFARVCIYVCVSVYDLGGHGFRNYIYLK